MILAHSNIALSRYFAMGCNMTGWVGKGGGRGVEKDWEKRKKEVEREREMEKEGNGMEKEGNGSREKGKEMGCVEKGRGRWSKKEMEMENKREMEVD